MFAYYPPEWERLDSRIIDRWCPSFSGMTGLQLPSTLGRNHGVLTNMDRNTSWQTNDAVALGFDGVNNFVNFVPPNFDPANGLTISLWLFIRSYTSTSFPEFFAIASNSNSIRINLITTGLTLTGGTIPPNGFLVQRGGGVGLAGSEAVAPLNTWVHGIYTWDRTISIWYQNGRASAISSFNGPNTGVVTRGYIGAGGTNAINPVNFGNCLIDDVTIFNTALTANEVRFVYEQGRGGGLLMQPPRRRSVAAIIAALVLACETGNYSLTGQAAGLFASRLLAADQAQFLLSGNAANITASRLLSADPASYTATGNDAATICARLLDGGAAAYALTGTDAGLIANRKLTADQAVCFLAGKNAELLRSLKLNAGSMALQLDNFAASLLANRKISADGAQYLLVVSDANLTGSASGVAPFYYLFMMRGPQ